MSRSSKKGPWVEERHGHVWRRRIGVLGRLRAKHATLPASLSGLPYVSVGGCGQR
jgi:hypothetical protein